MTHVIRNDTEFITVIRKSLTEVLIRRRTFMMKNGVPSSALADFGAATSCISGDVATKLGIPIVQLNASSPDLLSVDGVQLHCMGTTSVASRAVDSSSRQFSLIACIILSLNCFVIAF